jgi:hypothetical protein
MTDPELERLADAYALGILTPAEADRLNDHLRDNPDAQRQFLAITGIYARMQWEFASSAEPPVGHAPDHPRRLSWPWASAGLAAMLFVSIGAWFLLTASRAQASVALLRQTANARWHEASWQPGAALPPGPLRLETGLAELVFEDGAVAVLEGPAELDLLDRSGAFLSRGRVVLHCPADGSGFRLETPTSRLRDLGTEFGVGVGANGDTLLQVYVGEVLAEPKDDLANRYRIESGQAVKVRDSLTEVPFQQDRFVRVLPNVDDPTGRGKYPYNRVHHEEIHLVPPPGAVTIDADLTDWDLSGRIRSVCEPPYDEHHTLEAAMMYDADGLYVSAHVGDPFPMRSMISPDVPRNLYGMGGGVALRLSMDRKAGWPVPGLGAGTLKRRPDHLIDRNDKLAFLMLWHHQPSGLACLHARYGMDLHGAVVNPPGYRGAYRLDTNGLGYTLEYFLSWDLLHASDDPPRPGDTLGAMWLVHWSDPTGRIWKGQLIDVANRREQDWNFDRAATWGRAIYHAPGRLPTDRPDPSID